MVLNVVRYLVEPIRICHARKPTCLSGCVFHIFGLQNLQRHCQEKNSCSVIASGFLHRPLSCYACLKIVSYWIFLFIIALKHLTNMIFWGMTNSNRVKCARSNSHRTWLINSIHHLLNKGFSDKWSTLVVTNKISLSLSLSLSCNLYSEFYNFEIQPVRTKMKF